MFFKKKSFAAADIDFVVVGLGNPGAEYELTRHNAGFIAIDYIADKLKIKINKLKFKSLYCLADYDGRRVLFIQPHTYMNNSGEAVRDFLDFYKLSLDKTVVLCDDISLPVGKIRIRRSGSDGGQKGLRSIIYHTKSENFARIKIGIGEKPHPDYDLAAWVTSRFKPQELDTIKALLPDVEHSVRLIMQGNINQAMNLYN